MSNNHEEPNLKTCQHLRLFQYFSLLTFLVKTKCCGRNCTLCMPWFHFSFFQRDRRCIYYFYWQREIRICLVVFRNFSPLGMHVFYFKCTWIALPDTHVLKAMMQCCQNTTAVIGHGHLLFNAKQMYLHVSVHIFSL